LKNPRLTLYGEFKLKPKLHSGLLAKRCAFLISLQARYVSRLSPFFDWTGLIINLLIPK